MDVELPETLYHGTGEKYVSSILQPELVPKFRLYVHLSADLETAMKVGSRHVKPVVFAVDSARTHQEWLIFYRSVNGIWLTKEVPISYLHL